MLRLRERNEGQALVEFALIAPIFILLVLGVVEFGRAWQRGADPDRHRPGRLPHRGDREFGPRSGRSGTR